MYFNIKKILNTLNSLRFDYCVKIQKSVFYDTWILKSPFTVNKFRGLIIDFFVKALLFASH